MNDIAQQKTLDLARGLYLIRYEGSESAAPPVVRVFPDRGQAQNCMIITAPDAADGTLHREGALVVSVRQACRLVVEVTPQRPGGPTAANVKIETLSQGRVPSVAGSGLSPQAPANPAQDLRVVAHVAGIGDVTESANSWIAGPMAPARVEGLCLVWPGKPVDLDIRYAVRFARPQAGDNQFVPLGTFAGTRGRALPLTGVSLELSGPGAHRYNVTAEAIFLGAPASRITGQRINLSGPSGREPLVGIKIDVENVAFQPTVTQQSAPSAVPPSPPQPEAAAPAPRPAGRVRVFRSRQAGTKPAG